MSNLTVSTYGDRAMIRAATSALDPSIHTDAHETTLWIDDPVGLWEALTDALTDEHGEHLRAYVAGGARQATTPGVQAIARERVRQVDLGFDADHDRQHGARVFADQAAHLLGFDVYTEGFSPWCRRESDGEPSVDDLVRAGALIAAAIDRLTPRAVR